MNVADLRKMIANLPDDMDVRIYASAADELHVRMVETYPANPASYDKKATLMLCDKDVDGPGAGSTVIWDERDGE